MCMYYVTRCDNSGENLRAISRLAKVRCPGGLAFDIERQTCDWKSNVKNCKEVESKF
jgi:Chitin binding Peritrophin-A domain